jgi:Ni/Co efflux regulator RcnB
LSSGKEYCLQKAYVTEMFPPTLPDTISAKLNEPAWRRAFWPDGQTDRRPDKALAGILCTPANRLPALDWHILVLLSMNAAQVSSGQQVQEQVSPSQGFNMNYKIIVSSIMAISLGVGNVAYAQNDEHQRDRGRQDQNNEHRQDNERRGNDNRGVPGNIDYRGNLDSRDTPRNNDNQRVYAEGSRNDRADMQRHRFQRGDRLPPEYRERQYVVDDWRGHHLSAPPRGYHWVQSGGDYVLAAVATGLILQVLLSN